MSPNFTNCSSGADAAFVGLYSLIFTLGLLLNVAALWVFLCRGATAVHSITTIYMKNLAVCDLLLVASLPLRIYYYSGRPALPQHLCDVVGLLLLVNMYSSIFLLTCLSWDRCMAVCLPLSPRAKALRGGAKYICMGVWVLSCGGSIPFYFSQKKSSDRVEKCFDSRPSYLTSPIVSSAMMLCFMLPLGIMVTCSWALLRAVRHSTAAQMELVNGAKVHRMVVTNIAIFLGCFLPYHVVVLCYQAWWLPKNCLDMAYHWALLLACANAALDPLAYYFATETFQRMVTLDNLLKSWGSHCVKQRHSTTPLTPGIYLQNISAQPVTSSSAPLVNLDAQS